MSGTVWYDYPFKFLTTNLTAVLASYTALKAGGIMLSTAIMPQNMLGTPRDANGNVTTPDVAVWRGDPGNGSGGSSSTYYYIAIRTWVSPTLLASLGFNPATYDLVVCAADENAAVIGVWA